MSAPKVANKKPAAAARVDPAKVTTLRETFPFLSEEAATLHLTEANGNMSVATDLVLNGERWKTTSGAKPRKEKKDKVEEPERRERKPRDDRDRNEPRGERKPYVKRTDKSAAAPAAPEVTSAQVQQKDVASSSSWVKGQGLSFAEMVKRKKEAEAAPVAAPPPPPPPPAPVAPVVEAPVAPAAPPAVEATAAADEKPAKQRRERKPREVAAAAPAAVEAVPAAAPVAPVAVPVVVPKPVVVKHVLRFDRVDELLLPPHLADLALRSGNQYTFSGTPGVEQAPPPQAQPVNSFSQPTFAMQRAWGAPDHNMAQRWDNSASSWGQANAPQQQQQPPRFTTYAPQRFNNNSNNQFQSGGYQQQQQPPRPFNSNAMMPHHSHHRGQEHQASTEAYNAIREGNYTQHHTGATW